MVFSEKVTPRYPIYIVSKGRAESRLTSKALERMNVPYRIVIEPQEEAEYAAVIDPAKILVLPFSNLGQGSIPARNYIWEHSLKEGHARHWILDDNINQFASIYNSRKRTSTDRTPFDRIEEFCDRYSNVALAGMQYYAFVRQSMTEVWEKTFVLNTRIYSCILIQNNIPFRWRGRYNEDTDLSIRALKAGLCTLLFYAFAASKRGTMTYKGGNTEELYRQDEQFDGRFEMAKSLYFQHPDIVKITRKWGRWQHQVDYRPFRCNKLIPAERKTDV